MSTFTSLNPFPYKFSEIIPKPCNYGKNTFMLSTSCDELRCEPAVYEYNVNTNQLTLLHEYQDHFYPHEHGQIIDKSTNMLYMFGGANHSFAAFNLITKTIEYDDDNKLCDVGEWPMVHYIASTGTKDLHILLPNYKHLKYNNNNKNMVELTENMVGFEQSLYISSQNKLMIFGCGEYQREIYEYYLQNNVNQINQWKKYELVMPHQSISGLKPFDIILVSNIVFVFYFSWSGYSDIWCLDLLENKWFKSNKDFPRVSCDWTKFILKGDNNICHFINIPSGDHFKFSLYDIIPNTLYKKYRILYEPLIIGFIRKYENNQQIPHIPIVIKQLILLYFPCF